MSSPTLKKAKVTRSKRKLALLHGYRGAGYYGSSRSGDPTYRTIDDELEEALAKTEAIYEANQGDLRKIGWTRCARTDKGVSALANVVSCKLMISAEDEQDRTQWLGRLNEHLPPHIRVWAAPKVTGSFNAKKLVDCRTYEYLAPTYIFGNDLPPHDVLIERLNRITTAFEGTHAFHNFTSGKQPTDPSAKRYIISFNVPRVVDMKGQPFLLFRIKGQAFLIHQIRKMIGLVIRIVRDQRLDQCEAVVRGALSQSVFALPRAPALGLFLRTAHFGEYNRKYGAERELLELTEEQERQMEAWAQEFVYGDIADREAKEGEFRAWCDATDEHAVEYEAILNVSEQLKSDKPAE